VAFKECGYSKELLGKASIEWENKATNKNLDDPDTYKAFVEHRNSSQSSSTYIVTSERAGRIRLKI
jgi:hypothetical protein